MTLLYQRIVSQPDFSAASTAQATWWRSVDGASYRGYSDVSQDGQWQTLVPLMSLQGASAAADAHCHYVVETDVAPENEAALNAWYDTEHLIGLARVLGTVRASRFRCDGASPRYVACYDLVSLDVLESPPWLAVRNTVWSDVVRPMFVNPRRTMYERVSL